MKSFFCLTIITLVLLCAAFQRTIAQQDTTITIYGKRFAPGVEVYFNGQKLENIERISSRELRARIPLIKSQQSTQISTLKNQSAITSDDTILIIEDSIVVKNPSPSRGSSDTKRVQIKVLEGRRLGDFLGKWNQQTVKLFINDKTPREVIKELAIAVQAFNEILSSKLIIELDTINLVPERPTLVIDYQSDNKNVFGMVRENEFPDNKNQDGTTRQIPDGRIQPYPPILRDATTRDGLQSAESYHFKEVDIAFNETTYSNMMFQIGQVTPETSPVRNLTWVIAHELGHFLGLAHTYLMGETWETALMKANSPPKNWLGIPEREQLLLKKWYDVK